MIGRVVSVKRAVRRHHDPAGDRLAERAIVVQALERDAHEHLAARLQTREVLARREVGRVERVGAGESVRVVELLVVGPFDEHARRAVAAAPHDDRSVAGVAELHALRRLRTLRVRGDDRGRTLRQGPVGQRDASDRGRTGLQEASPGRRNRFVHSSASQSYLVVAGLTTMAVMVNSRGDRRTV